MSETTVNLGNINSLNKTQLLQLVQSLHTENTELRKIKEFNERLESIERKLNIQSQYYRRESVEISGINPNIKQEDLEQKVIEICNASKVEIDGQGVTKRDITACHRIGRKGKTICRFVNRKFANGLLYNSRNLKEFEQLKSIYVNNSFC